MTGTPVRILLARHGETVFNVERRYQGQSDSPLTERGVEQARQLARMLRDEPVGAVYSSDLGRALETALSGGGAARAAGVRRSPLAGGRRRRLDGPQPRRARGERRRADARVGRAAEARCGCHVARRWSTFRRGRCASSKSACRSTPARRWSSSATARSASRSWCMAWAAPSATCGSTTGWPTARSRGCEWHSGLGPDAAAGAESGARLMPLDLLETSTQVRQMGELLAHRRADEQRRLTLLDRMLEAYRDRWQELAELAEQVRERVAVPTGPLDERMPAPDRPTRVHGAGHRRGRDRPRPPRRQRRLLPDQPWPGAHPVWPARS